MGLMAQKDKLLTVEPKVVIAENTISVGHCVIPTGRDLNLIAQSFGWDLKPRSILATLTFDLVEIKRSWHSTKGGSEIVSVKRVSVTKQIPSMHRRWRVIKVGKEKSNRNTRKSLDM